MSDYADDPAFRAWKRRVETELVPKLRESAVTVSLVPEGETDAKFAVELGMSIMLDKPIIAVVSPGTKVPDKLVRVADHIIEGTVTDAESVARLQERIAALLDGMGDA